MSHRPYFLLSGAIFFVVATAHLARLIMGWEITIAGWDAPPWVSIPGLIIPGVLSAWGFVLALRTGVGRIEGVYYPKDRTEEGTVPNQRSSSIEVGLTTRGRFSAISCFRGLDTEKPADGRKKEGGAR